MIRPLTTHPTAQTVRTVLLVALAWLATAPHSLTRRLRQSSDEGSETTEKAVLTAIGLGLAVGLGAAITAVVHKYQAQIH